MPLKKRTAKRPARRRYRAKRSYQKKVRKHGSRIAPLVVSNSHLAKLEYIDVDTPTLTCSTLITFVGNFYRMNGLFDVNPSIASSAVPGFTEWARFFNRYRVYACSLDVECTNLFPNNALYLVTHLQADAAPSTFTNWASFRRLEGNKYTKVSLMSSSGGQNRTHHRLHCYLPTIFGDKAYRTDLNYAGFTGGADTGANPNRMLNANIALLSQDGNVFPVATTIPLNVKLTFWVEFFDRIDLVN